jgi:hypothetical protein
MLALSTGATPMKRIFYTYQIGYWTGSYTRLDDTVEWLTLDAARDAVRHANPHHVTIYKNRHEVID